MKNIYLFLFLFIASCSKNEKVKIDKYFDLETYFKKEARRLEEGRFKLEKKLIKGHDSETVVMDSLDWKKVMALFIACDINKLSWINSYSVDSVISDGNLKVVYRSLESNLPVRKIEIFFTDKTPAVINIEKGKENFYYTSTENYQYMPSGFFVKARQKVRLTDEVKYEIIVRFIH